MIEGGWSLGIHFTSALKIPGVRLLATVGGYILTVLLAWQTLVYLVGLLLVLPVDALLLFRVGQGDTGVVCSEGVVSSLAIAQVFKRCARRQRSRVWLFRVDEGAMGSAG